MDKIILRKTEVDGRHPADAVEGPLTGQRIVLSGTEIAGRSAGGSEPIQLCSPRPAIVVRGTEVAERGAKGTPPVRGPQAAATGASAAETLPVRAQVFLWVLTPLLPLLCLAVLTIRLVLRDAPAWTRLAWLGQMNSRLLVGGLLWVLLALVIWVRPHPGTTRNTPGTPTAPAEPPTAEPAANQGAAQLSKEDLFARFAPLTVIIRTDNSLGGGVILATTSQGTIIGTARHVVGSMEGSGNTLLGKMVRVESTRQELERAEVVGVHRSLDLALVWMDGQFQTTAVCVPIRRVATINVGEDVQAIGHPEGYSFSLAPGTISREVGNDWLIHITAPLWHGFSGGPLLDMHGNLVAINTAIRSANNHDGVEVPVPGLAFATVAEPFLRTNEWYLNRSGSKWLADFAARSPGVTGSHSNYSEPNNTNN
jgi:S1-C subfamily serine protease